MAELEVVWDFPFVFHHVVDRVMHRNLLIYVFIASNLLQMVSKREMERRRPMFERCPKVY